MSSAVRTQGRILVVRGGAIGDFILTLPVLRALRERFPSTHIEVLGYPHIVSLAGVGGWIDGTARIEAQALAGFFARAGRLDERLQEYFARFNIVLSYLYDPDGFFKQNVQRSSSAQFIQGCHRPDEESGAHATQAFLAALESLAIFDADPVPRLDWAGDEAGSEGTWLAVHPGSGSERKNWPEPNWQRMLTRLLAESPVRLLLVGGEAEEGRTERMAGRLDADRVELAIRQPLPELAQRLARCHAFVGHDSGITHLAAAVGVPVVCLWGPTRAEVWRPMGARTRLVRAPSGALGDLSVEDVLAAVLAALRG